MTHEKSNLGKKIICIFQSFPTAFGSMELGLRKRIEISTSVFSARPTIDDGGDDDDDDTPRLDVGPTSRLSGGRIDAGLIARKKLATFPSAWTEADSARS